jgi:hypothetical protein
MASDESTTYENLLKDNNIITASDKANQERIDESVLASK